MKIILFKEYFLKMCLERHPEIDHSILEYTELIITLNWFVKHIIFVKRGYLNYSKGCKYCNETKVKRKLEFI